MTPRVHLGKASFFHPKSQIRLESEASVEFSAEGAVLSSSFLESSQFLHAEIWTRAKPCFLVALRICINEGSLSSRLSHRSLLTAVASAIGDAELWSQLQLRADIDLMTDYADASMPWTYFLKLELRTRQETTYHGLDGSCQVVQSNHDAGNIKPPPGICTLLLDSIDISLSLSCPKSTSILPRKRSWSEPEALVSLLNETIPTLPNPCHKIKRKAPSTDDEGGQDSAWQQYYQAGFSKDLYHVEDVIEFGGDTVASREDFQDIISSAMADGDEETDSAIFSSQGSTVLQTSVACRDTIPEPDLLLDQRLPITSLVDAALRNVICARPLRTAPGIQADTSALSARLADLSPSVFCPGYAEAVAARATLIPAVAHFIASLLQKSTSTVVKSKREGLITQFSNRYGSSNPKSTYSTVDDTAKIKEVIKEHVWVTMTNGLRDSEGARRLKPIFCSAASTDIRADSMLDGENTISAGSRLGMEMKDGFELYCSSEGDKMLEPWYDGGGEEQDRDIAGANEDHFICCSIGTTKVGPGDRDNGSESTPPTVNPWPTIPPPSSANLYSNAPSSPLTCTIPPNIASECSSSRNLLDEESTLLPPFSLSDPAQPRHQSPTIATSPSVLLLEQEHQVHNADADEGQDDEPAFEQWEFNVEQGYEYYDADTLFLD